MTKILDFLTYFLTFQPGHYTPEYYYETQAAYARLGRPDLMPWPYWKDCWYDRIAIWRYWQ